MTTHPDPNPMTDEQTKAGAVLQWLLAHSYLNESGCIEFGPGFNQTRPGILAGMLIDEMNGWHGVCQFCNAGAELYADGLPTGDACSHCKGKGSVNELRKEDIDDYYEALSEQSTPQPPPEAGSVPDGFVLVPKVPTLEMLQATRRSHAESIKRWAAMLSAAPAPKESP